LNKINRPTGNSIPPVIKTNIFHLRTEVLQTNPLQEGEPEFSSKHAWQQQVVDVFLVLVTMGASSRMLKVTSCKSISCPTLFLATNHMKKWHFPGAQDFQILSQGWKAIVPWKNAA